MNTEKAMDMRISGSGKIPAGEYGKISISGSGQLVGHVRCASFSASGSGKGASIECGESLKVSGSVSFEEDIKAGQIGVSGAFHCGGDVKVQEGFSCSGSAKCKKNVACNNLSVSGALHVGGDIEAEQVNVNGNICCGGLLNGESVRIKYHKHMNIGSIGGSKIVIFPEEKKSFFNRLPLFSSLVAGDAEVTSSIEGDEIALEGVTCPRVTGRVVAIGANCSIELVQYSETVEISPDAKVGRTEKI